MLDVVEKKIEKKNNIRIKYRKMDMMDIPQEVFERHLYGWLYINIVILKYIIIPILIMIIIVKKIWKMSR